MTHLIALILTVGSAHAMDVTEYWKQLYGSQQIQCGTTMVDLAKQLDDAKTQITELQKQLNAKGGGNAEHKP